MLKRFERNAVIFEESEPAERFYVVDAGSLRLYKASQGGRELSTRIIGSGNCTCCAPLFGNRRHCVSARALEDSTLIVVPAEIFREMIGSTLHEVGMVILSCLSRRVAHLSNLLGDVTFKGVEERVLRWLLRTARERSLRQEKVPLPFTHSDIASMTGTVREVVSRIMSRLKREGIITDSTVRGFRVDIDKLARFLRGA